MNEAGLPGGAAIGCFNQGLQGMVCTAYGNSHPVPGTVLSTGSSSEPNGVQVLCSRYPEAECRSCGDQPRPWQSLG
jgi:hypothetical protein